MSKMLERCIKEGLLQLLEPKPLPNPLPAKFNLRAYCKFHQSKGHDTDNCKRLRHEIQDLIDQGNIPDPEKGILTSEPRGKLVVTSTGLTTVNAPREFVELNVPMSEMLKELQLLGLLQPLEPKPLPNPLPASFNLQAYCNFHRVKGHYTDKCRTLRHEIQDLIDQGKIPNPEKGMPTLRPTHSQTNAPQCHLKTE